MSEEIKIILNIIEKASKREANSYNALMQTDSKKYKQLLDYITNLQQENKQLKEEIARLKEWKEDLINENIKLESIRKEVIEYIKEDMQYDENIDDCWCRTNELLEILGDKENEKDSSI